MNDDIEMLKAHDAQLELRIMQNLGAPWQWRLSCLRC